MTLNVLDVDIYSKAKLMIPITSKCRKCEVPLIKGIALVPIYTGTPDFLGDTQVVTMSPSGNSKLVACLKCPACGWSIHKDKLVPSI